MRRILLLSNLLLFFAIVSNAQTDQLQQNAAKSLVSANKTALGLSGDDLNNLKVYNTYLTDATGIRMAYMQQTYKGIPVYNQILVLSFRGDKLLSSAGKFNSRMDELVTNKTGVPSISAAEAVQAALLDRKLSSTEALIQLGIKQDGQVEFNKAGISLENITAKLIWSPTGKDIKLAWQVFIVPSTSSDYWLVQIDAADRSTVAVDNMTDYDNWGPVKKDSPLPISVAVPVNTPAKNFFASRDAIDKQVKKVNGVDVVTTATYRVIRHFAESPQAPGGGHALVTDPWTSAPGNATTLKWHTGAGATDYDYTRGNNTWAYQDRSAPTNTGTVAKSTASTTAFPNLTFDFTPNYSTTPLETTPAPNVQFNTTNVFYMANVMHDVMYLYGFTESAANFQDDNMGRGGVGNDHVNAEAQDNSGTNNANFSTPADGGSGRMQMYLWNINGSNPSKDGDVDNSIIAHEFGHGISNRFTGGGVSTCLNNLEQMGEGWSDFFGLMITTNWATATLTDGFNIPRPIGTYALNNVNLFPTSPPGSGIRHFPYSTNLAVNPSTYLTNLPAGSPHDLGEIWGAILWDMAWNIIQQTGTITPSIYTTTGTGGNIIAMKLVAEGLRLQQCSPGFVSGRNAILQADQNLFGGTYRCAIINAFTRRGVGMNASEGSTNNVNDQVVDFGYGLVLNQTGIVPVPEGQNIIYNNKVTTALECISTVNFLLTDTLPLNVTFVSATNGGTYNAGNRVVSWPVNLGPNSVGNYGFTVNINAGSYFAPVTLINETVPSNTIPAAWTPASTTANVWIAHSTRSHSAPSSFFSPDVAAVSDQTLTTTSSFALGASPPTLSFWHWYNTESTFDGGVLEISTNGGGSWSDIGAANFTKNGYNSTIDGGFSSPIANRAAWSGNSAAFIETKVNMAPYANQANVKLRWRMASDVSVAATGWNVDDILLQSIARVDMRSSLFDASGTRILISDTTTLIAAPVAGSPTVTINQSITQSDPTSVSPINFTVTFSEAVTGFNSAADVILSGTAGATTVVITGGPVIYNVAVSGMTTSGTVIATVPAGAANGATLPNVASTSTDNVVNYNFVCPAVIYAYRFNNNHLLSFNASTPGTIATDVAITGINSGEFLLGIDFRPATGELFSVGASGTVSRVVTINTTTAAITQVGTFTPILDNLAFYGTDFNPTVDRIRLVNENDLNIRLNPITGALAATDVNLSYAVGDLNFGVNPAINHVAYTNNFAGATQTTLYGIDVNLNTLVMIGGLNGVPSPNGGVLTTIGSLGVNPTTFGGFDIEPGTNTAYAALQIAGVMTLYSINLTTGAATLIGPIGSGIAQIDGISIAPCTTPCVLTCPANIIKSNDPNQCGAVVTFAAPTTSGTCGTVTASPASGSFFPIGTTTVIATSSNGGSCSFTVTVNDTQPPTITCPAAVTVSCASAVPAANPAGVTRNDNCPNVTVALVGDVISNQTCANRYTLTRTYRATDNSGNTATCSQIITVNDQTAPVVTCPANMNVTTPIGSCTAVVNFTPTATDNCTGAVTITSVPASGSNFSIGTTPVIVTATDACGNFSTCTFSVTVADGQLPVITAHPVNNTSVCEGLTATFSVTATNAVSYTWQIWNGTTWVNVAGGTGATLTLPNVTMAMNTNTYRVIVNGLCTPVISNPATLRVFPAATVSILAAPPSILPNQLSNFSAIYNNGLGSFVWSYNGTVVPGVTGFVLGPLYANQAGSYQVVYTDPNGCKATSAAQTLTAIVTDMVLVYPNPNNGQFHVRYYNQQNEKATINVYDALGQRIYTKAFTTSAIYTQLDIDLGYKASGIYSVEIVDGSGNIKGSKKILVNMK